MADVPLHKESECGFHLKNGFFEGGEAELWYALMRHFKPIAENRRENPDYVCRHVCIDSSHVIYSPMDYPEKWIVDEVRMGTF